MLRAMKKTIIAAAFLVFFVFTSSIYAEVPISNSLAPMLQNVLPAVVNIKSQIKITDFNTLREIIRQRRNTESGGDALDQPLPNTYMSLGSGVIVDAARGLIVTNAHVINDAQSITVTLSDGRHYTAKVIGLDKPSDIGLIQIKAKNLTAIPLGDSNSLKVGDVVAAIGNPFGLNQSVTSGIVSALGRTTLGIENYENFIQTDAPINPGNSGGALINTSGQLIGVNTAILAPDRGSIGIGFAIPANMVKSVVRQLIEFGDVKRGVLGIGVLDITPELATAFDVDVSKGAIVTQVLPASPAELSGLQVGDIILSVDNSQIKNASDVVNTIGFLRVNSKVNIALLRNNKKMTATVTLSDPKVRKQAIEKTDPFLYGVGLKNFTLLSPVHGNVEGVAVVSVEVDSNAWNSDIRPGDVITSVNQTKIRNIDDLKAALQKADKMVLLNVLRGANATFLVINREP